MFKAGYTYILAAGKYGTLYIGVTFDLVKRVWQHQQGEIKGFTQKYGVKTLVYYDVSDSIEAAIEREKQLKRWHRQWKINLIEESNPSWRDLYSDIIG